MVSIPLEWGIRMCECAPGLVVEQQRLASIGASFLGCIGDANHSFGAHLCDPPPGDYTLAGDANTPVGDYACAIDIGADWPASREWLQWLIAEIREDRITGIFEVIGSFDGEDVRYWSDSSGWQQEGVPYQGTGHDTWMHVAIYRSTALEDHKILAGWTATGYGNAGDDDMPQGIGPLQIPASPHGHRSYSIWPVNQGSAGFGPAWLSIWGDFFGRKAAIRLALSDGNGNWSLEGTPPGPGEDPRIFLESGKKFVLQLPTGIQGLSITRVPVDAKDDCTASVSMSIEYARR